MPDPAAVFQACACAMTARRELDELLLAVLAAPGLGLVEADRLGAWLASGRLRQGQAALELVCAAAGQGEEESW